jgi:Dolichyl-phosphate-mannose-protein mannosyltransferase
MKPRSWAVVLLILLCVGLVRYRLLETPLERDEGEYAYVAQLLLQGIPPYKLAYSMKLPGTPAAYSFLMAIFGQTVVGIHIGLLLVNAAAVVLVAILGVRLFGVVSGLVACATFALMSLGSGVLGVQAHATHFVVLAALGGCLLLLNYSNSRLLLPLWGSGTLFGLAFLMKQPGVSFGLFGAFWLIATEWRQGWRLLSRLLVFAAAVATPFALMCVLLWWGGVIENFWFWTFTYAATYGAEISPFDGLLFFLAHFWGPLNENLGLWILAAVGLVRLRRNGTTSALFVGGLLVFSFLAMCPGWHFRSHYFVLVLPAVALLTGAAISERLFYYLFAAALVFSILTQRDLLFGASPIDVSRSLYRLNPFPEAVAVANYIRARSERNMLIAVLGSEPEIYFYSNRYSATPYIYMYPLMEKQPYAQIMQRDLIEGVTIAAPEFVVEAVSRESWREGDQVKNQILEWWSCYRRQHYQLVGIADILAKDYTEYRWDAAVEGYRPRSDTYLAVYRRANASPEDCR